MPAGIRVLGGISAVAVLTALLAAYVDRGCDELTDAACRHSVVLVDRSSPTTGVVVRHDGRIFVAADLGGATSDAHIAVAGSRWKLAPVAGVDPVTGLTFIGPVDGRTTHDLDLEAARVADPDRSGSAAAVSAASSGGRREALRPTDNHDELVVTAATIDGTQRDTLWGTTTVDVTSSGLAAPDSVLQTRDGVAGIAGTGLHLPAAGPQVRYLAATDLAAAVARAVATPRPADARAGVVNTDGMRRTDILVAPAAAQPRTLVLHHERRPAVGVEIRVSGDPTTTKRTATGNYQYSIYAQNHSNEEGLTPALPGHAEPEPSAGPVGSIDGDRIEVDVPAGDVATISFHRVSEAPAGDVAWRSSVPLRHQPVEVSGATLTSGGATSVDGSHVDATTHPIELVAGQPVSLSLASPFAAATALMFDPGEGSDDPPGGPWALNGPGVRTSTYTASTTGTHTLLVQHDGSPYRITVTDGATD